MADIMSTSGSTGIRGVSALAGGAIGGLAGGMMMAMFAMLVAIGGDGFWAPVRGITSVVFGDAHYGGSFALGPVAIGAMGHMMNSIILGAVFGGVVLALRSKLSNMSVLVLGAAYGIALWVVMVLVVANAAQSSGLFADAIPAWAWFLGHMMYGLVLGIAVLVSPSMRQR